MNVIPLHLPDRDTPTEPEGKLPETATTADTIEPLRELRRRLSRMTPAERGAVDDALRRPIDPAEPLARKGSHLKQ